MRGGYKWAQDKHVGVAFWIARCHGHA